MRTKREGNEKSSLWSIVAIGIIAVVMVIVLQQFWRMSSQEKNGDDKKDIKIGIALYNAEDTFLNTMINALKVEALSYEQKEKKQIYINIADGNEDQDTQNKQIERFIDLGYDVLCVNMVNRYSASSIIDMAKAADIPIVFFNREPVQEDLESWDRIYYVGTDARRSAELQGEIVINAIEEGISIDTNGDGIIQYIMLEGESRHQDAVIRTEVSITTLREAGLNMEKLDGDIANWDKNQASVLAERYFQKYGDAVELIICNNDDMALGAMEAAEKLGLTFNRIVGIDGTSQGRSAVMKGGILGTVNVHGEDQGKAIFSLAAALAIGEDPHSVVEIDQFKSVRVPMTIEIKKDNKSKPPM